MDNQRVLDLLLMQAADGCAWRPRRERRKLGRLGRLLRLFVVAWVLTRRQATRAWRWFAWRTWERAKISRGRERWRMLAGIGRSDHHEERPHRIGYIQAR